MKKQMRTLSYFSFFIVIFFIQSCASKKPNTVFNSKNTPPAPDYSNLKYWAAHPDKNDPADSIPLNSGLKNNESNSDVDIFFVHPTTYLFKRGHRDWNADVNNLSINKKTDDGSILYQASIFNGAGRVYAPRYRQAHYYSYMTSDRQSAKQAFDLAYSDVKAAFEFYLKNWNKGRKIIIASHSQGTQHATHLLKEYFDDKPLLNQLVVAYIVGLPVRKNEFKTIPICENEIQNGCFCSWRTFQKGYEPNALFPLGEEFAVVNPLSWSTQKEVILPEKHKGAVLIGFKLLPPKMIEAQIHKGILWVNKPQFKGSFLYRSKNFHAGDFNIFYMNVREDVENRIKLFNSKS